MSMHKIQLTPLEESGLKAHGLAIGTPSQLSDAFRQGVAWASESLRQQLAECQATSGMLRSDMSLFLDSHEECEDFDGFTAQIVSMDDYHKAQDALALPNDDTALNELIAERTACLTAELQSTRLQMITDFGQYQEAHENVKELTAQRDAAIETLVKTRQALEIANEMKGGPICDTIWMPSLCSETLFDFLDAAIANCKEPGK